MENINEDLLNSFIGIDKESCLAICKQKKINFRITRNGSDYYVVTHDLRFDRVNLEIDNGKVTKCKLG